MLTLYNLLLPLALLFLLPGQIFRMLRRGGYGNKMGQRFGFFDPETRARLRRREDWIWIHAVSVGETLVALKLIRALRQAEPGCGCLLSVTTSTGLALARKRFSDDDATEIIWHPLDFPLVIRAVLRLVRPRRIAFVEALVWPNLLAQAEVLGIPVSVVNARMSPRSERRYGKFSKFTRPLLFAPLRLVCLQEAGDAEKWSGLGVRENFLSVTGSIKYDQEGEETARVNVAELLEILQQGGVRGDGPLLLAGSTWPGEEKVMGEVFMALRTEFPGLRMVVAPRHAERAPEARRDLAAAGLRVVRRTEISPGKINWDEADALLLDTTGELVRWYQIADVVFIGKSLFTAGGQNPVEALAAGRAVVCGPRMENFAALMIQLEKCGGVARIGSPEELAPALAGLLRNAEACVEMAGRATAALETHRGAAARTARDIMIKNI